MTDYQSDIIAAAKTAHTFAVFVLDSIAGFASLKFADQCSVDATTVWKGAERAVDSRQVWAFNCWEMLGDDVDDLSVLLEREGVSDFLCGLQANAIELPLQRAAASYTHASLLVAKMFCNHVNRVVVLAHNLQFAERSEWETFHAKADQVVDCWKEICEPDWLDNLNIEALAINLRKELRCLTTERAARTKEPTGLASAVSHPPLSDIQAAVMNALHKRAYRKEDLGIECRCDPSRLTRKSKNKGPSIMQELMLWGLVKKGRTGYYRPDAPPEPGYTQ